jgi:protein-tyrosine phosphatase
MGIPVEVLLGGDVSALLHPATVREHTINNSRYVLVEFPHRSLPTNSMEILFALSLQGLCPIITHPERNAAVVENPDKLLDMLHGNVLVQITAGSLCGEFGRDEQACAVHLLRKGVVHFLGTDAHAVHSRPPILSAGLKVAEKIVGREQALKLVQDNPEVVLQDKPFLDR